MNLEGITLSRGNQVLLEQANFSLYAGDKIGLIGRNGSGKSSLFGLILGQYREDEGQVYVPKSWGITYLAQAIPEGKLSAKEYVLHGHAKYIRYWHAYEEALDNEDGEALIEYQEKLEEIDGFRLPTKAAEILVGLGFTNEELDKAVDDFSGGWRMRLNLARALICPEQVLLLDEPTNHLDLDAIVWLEKWLKSYEGMIILIAHDSAFLDSVVNKIAHIANKKIDMYTGNYTSFIRQRAQNLIIQQKMHEKQQKVIEHYQSFITRFKAKASKAKQAQSRAKALERMELVASVHIDSPFSFEFLPVRSCPNPILRLGRVSVGYGEKVIISDINRYLGPGDRVGLLGLNGAGKSTFIKLLAGVLAPMSGDKVVASNPKIGYFAQHQLELLNPELSLVDWWQEIFGNLNIKVIREILAKFAFTGDKVFEKIGVLSGGEKSRLILAKLVYEEPHLLLLDEPTNHLDLDMREALTLALQSFDGAMVLVSHDRELLQETTDKLWLVDSGQVTDFDGDMSDYVKWLDNKRISDSGIATSKAKAGKVIKVKSANHQQIKAQLEKDIQKQEKQIALIQEKLAKIETVLQDPSLYENVTEANKKKLAEYLSHKKDAEKKLQESEATWIKLHDQLDGLE
jgi:ATP-binding cassette subfamily F protein 3